MSRMTNDVENISTTISQSIGSLISGVLTIVGTVVIMLLYSPLLTVGSGKILIPRYAHVLLVSLLAIIIF